MIKRILKGSTFFIIMVGVVLLARYTQLDEILEASWAKNNFANAGPQGVLLYLAVVAVFSTIGMPRQALAIAGGYAYGAVIGTLWVSLGLTIGCALGFFFARFFASNFVQRKFGNKLKHIEHFLSLSPFATAIAIRCFPTGNNAITNMLAGVTKIPAVSFIAGSCIGYLPQNIIFALLGSGIEVNTFWRTTIAAILFVASSAFGIYLFKHYRAKTGRTAP